jgi:hypothetical protein
MRCEVSSNYSKRVKFEKSRDPGRRCREIQDAGAEGSRPAGKAVGAEIEWHNENVR